MSASKIVRAAIHPGIGIARVGDSRDEYFIGPEVPYATPAPEGGYKDETGALKRQAARFRIYGYDAAGRVVKELTADDAEITWTVHVANKKAAWYNFEVAMDIPAATPCERRNASFTGGDRKGLAIDPGPRSIKGRDVSGDGYRFDSGKFLGEKVYLGELRTDEAGNLIFLGGRGVSNTVFPHNTLNTFANNDGWHDDTSDGPVSAEVTIGGEKIPVDPAWVVVAPPNYAPDLITVQTLYDVLYDTFLGRWLTPTSSLSFTRHIYPILTQFSETQWVNYGYFVQFGWGAPYDFLQPDYFKKLSSNRKEYAEVRLQLFNIFRDPSSKVLDPKGWPQLYGDNAFGSDPNDPLQYMSVTKTQYKFLKQWAAGNFRADWDPKAPPPPARIEDVRLEDRPRTLDKAALHFCMGGPFHPGCEMTWPMRHLSMYYAPFRIRPRAANQPEPDYGDMLTTAAVNSNNGPLFANGPGDITRWMAVPWQADTASCRSGYITAYDPYIPTFWPSRVPNHVLAEENYAKVLNTALPEDERMLAFNARSTWYRLLEGEYLQQINQMVTDFGKLGVVERRAGVQGSRYFPPVMYVETQAEIAPGVAPTRNTFVGRVDKVTRQWVRHRQQQQQQHVVVVEETN